MVVRSTVTDNNIRTPFPDLFDKEFAGRKVGHQLTVMDVEHLCCDP